MADDEMQTPEDEAPADADASLDEEPVAEDAADDAPTDDAPADETPAAEAPTDEAPAAEAPTDEAPADETPTDEAPADEAPAAAGGSTQISQEDIDALLDLPVRVFSSPRSSAVACSVLFGSIPSSQGTRMRCGSDVDLTTSR